INFTIYLFMKKKWLKLGLPIVFLGLLAGCGKPGHGMVATITGVPPEVQKVNAVLEKKGQTFMAADEGHAKIEEPYTIKVDPNDGYDTAQYVKFKYLEPIKLNGKEYGIYKVQVSGEGIASSDAALIKGSQYAIVYKQKDNDGRQTIFLTMAWKKSDFKKDKKTFSSVIKNNYRYDINYTIQ
ncbi:hypothetical protein, partial [Latilactobacillus sakei]